LEKTRVFKEKSRPVVSIGFNCFLFFFGGGGFFAVFNMTYKNSYYS